MRVVIIGASVAGASLAYCLARRGVEVEAYDKATFPRWKACGEGLLPHGVAALREMGLVPPIAPRVRGLRFTAPRGASVDADFAGGQGLVVRRDRFDAWLLEQARSAGALIHEGMRAPEAPHADLIVAADGLHSRYGEPRADRPQRLGFSTHVTGLAASDRVEVGFHKDGESYVAPMGEMSLVSALYYVDRFKRAKPTDPIEHLLGPGRPFERVTPLLAINPLGRRVKHIVQDNLLLIGDAAGASDPITGEGLSLALRSALVASEAILAGKLDTYADWRRREGDRIHRFGRFLLKLSSLADLAVPRLAKHPELVATMMAISQGERRFKDIRAGDLLRALW